MTDLALSPARRRLSLFIAMVCIASVGTTMGLTWPLLSLILDSRGVSSGLIGLSAASQALSVFAVAPLAPAVIARFGVLRVVTGAIVATAAMFALLPLHIDPYVWMPIRFLLGGSVGLLFIAGQTWINQTAIDESRGLVGGVLGFLWSAGFAFGPVIITLAGIEGWAPFLCGIALVLASALPLLFAGGLAPPIATDGPRRGYWRLFPVAALALLAAPMLATTDSINDSFLSLYAMRHGFTRPDAVLLLTTLFVGTTVGHLPVGWLADRIDRRKVLTATVALSLLLALAMIAAMPAGWPAWPVAFFWGAAMGGVWTVAFAMVGDRFRGTELAAATTLSSLLYGIGSSLGPVIAGHAMELWGPAATLVVSALALAAYLAVCVALGRRSATQSTRRTIT
ncbi:MAG TPA: MFS transporter [Hypericibacter adhaerens]|uniref:MFS transporter n=1 Tax=Hypericibacter adhaerens TaxID=2602016 RepID=UPI002CF3909F|nr:MFS transporter [Hypericibacter adhaerens]HWA44813.1 MFS transporter [Hypericibacter adhaerens]